MGGRWLELWLQKTGRAEPEDLSGVLAVQLGTHTEALNLLWFDRPDLGPITGYAAQISASQETVEFSSRRISRQTRRSVGASPS
jgi:hypothetical protein